MVELGGTGCGYKLGVEFCRRVGLNALGVGWSIGHGSRSMGGGVLVLGACRRPLIISLVLPQMWWSI